MRIRFLEIAEIELDQAIEYYNYESPGLGDAFLTEALKHLIESASFPKRGIPYRPELGDAKCGGFPME